MTPGEFREIAKAMKEFGLSHVKMGDVELHMGQDNLMAKVPEASGFDSSNLSPAADSNDPIKHKIEEMTSLLKLDDKDLVDHLFPDHTQEAPGEAL